MGAEPALDMNALDGGGPYNMDRYQRVAAPVTVSTNSGPLDMKTVFIVDTQSGKAWVYSTPQQGGTISPSWVEITGGPSLVPEPH